MHTFETLKKSYDSYMDAVARITEVFPRLDISSSGYTHRIAESFYGCGNAAGSEIFATGCDVVFSSLFEHGRPIYIRPSFFLWTSSFFSIHLLMDIPWTMFHEQGEDSHKLRVYYGHKRSFGLVHWLENRAKIEKIAKACTSPVTLKIVEALDAADGEITKWKEAIKAQPPVEVIV